MRSVSAAVDLPVELRQLRYFVAVAEELHFGRAAERLHMSQSPLSRAIRELERELGLVLFVRTTRRVELTPAGSALLERARLALAEDRSGGRRRASCGAGRGAESWRSATGRSAVRWRRGSSRSCRGGASGARASAGGRTWRRSSSRRVAAHELAAAAALETPAAARRHGVRVDALRDEPLLAALPATHRYADADAIPIGAFAAECVLLAA